MWVRIYLDFRFKFQSVLARSQTSNNKIIEGLGFPGQFNLVDQQENQLNGNLSWRQGEKIEIKG